MLDILESLQKEKENAKLILTLVYLTHNSEKILSRFELHTESMDRPNESLVLRAVPPQSPK